jgi:hypothetical protein
MNAGQPNTRDQVFPGFCVRKGPDLPERACGLIIQSNPIYALSIIIG